MCEKYYECVFFGKKEKRKKKRRKLFLTRIVDLVPVWNVICVKTKQTTKKNSLVSKCLIFFNFSIHKNLYICILFWWRFVHSGWSMGDWFPYIRFLWMDLFWWLDSSKNRLPFFFYFLYIILVWKMGSLVVVGLYELERLSALADVLQSRWVLSWRVRRQEKL